MLTTIFITLPYTVIHSVLSLLPEGGTLPALAHTAASELGSYLGLIAPIVPTDTLVQVLLLRLQIEILIFAVWDIPNWLYGKIPFIGK